MDSYKKLCDKENAEIKSIMKDFAVQKYEAGGYKASYTVSTRESMDEEMLISLFTSVPGFIVINDRFNVIKMRPYVDFDALENAIYNNALTNDQLIEMDKAKEVKEVVTLRITKVKEAQEN